MTNEAIQEQLHESANAKLRAAETMADGIKRAIEMMLECFRGKKKVLICGNGGSAADAQHFAAEFVNRFRKEREPLPVMALTTDTSVLTSIGNDSSFDNVFEKPVRAFGQEGDLLFVITTSDIEDIDHGHSSNLARALHAAKDRNLRSIGLVSQKSKRILEQLDLALIVPHNDTARIQEVHATVLHIISDLVEKELFPNHDR